MRKTWTKFTCILFIITLFITGCGVFKTTVSYTYAVETGDYITISLLTNDGYKLKTDLPFEISKDDEELSIGMFMTVEEYKKLIDVVKNDKEVTVIEEGKKDNLDYVFWSRKGREYNYFIMIEGANTGVVIGNDISEDSAKECFNRLEFKCRKQ